MAYRIFLAGLSGVANSRLIPALVRSGCGNCFGTVWWSPGGVVRPAAPANRCPTATPLDDDRACPTLAKPINIWRGSNRFGANALRKAAVNPFSVCSYASAPTPDRPSPISTLATNKADPRQNNTGCRSRAPASAGAREKASTVGAWLAAHHGGEGRKRCAPRKICHTPGDDTACQAHPCQLPRLRQECCRSFVNRSGTPDAKHFLKTTYTPRLGPKPPLPQLTLAMKKPTLANVETGGSSPSLTLNRSFAQNVVSPIPVRHRRLSPPPVADSQLTPMGCQFQPFAAADAESATLPRPTSSVTDWPPTRVSWRS